MLQTRVRLSLVEYGSPVSINRENVSNSGISVEKTKQLLLEAGSRASSNLGYKYNPISVDGKGARAIDFAGLIRLSPTLELEVVPKFLKSDESSSTWREDFFFLATLSRHGRLLTSERISTTIDSARDLPTLVARSMIQMYEANKRKPLRSYRKVQEEDFFIDGDPEPIDLLLPTSDGFRQEVIRFDRLNKWNTDIAAAAKELLPEISDPTVAGSLIRLIEDLPPQSYVTNRRKPIPTRHRAWEPLHELALDVLQGLGLSYKSGRSEAPGYIVDTWRIWEDLLTVSVRLAFGKSAVIPQRGFTLGSKTKFESNTTSKISVYPDCVISANGNRPKILLDAKYKGHIEKGQLRISESDIYEALAFSRATGCLNVVLAYPQQASHPPRPLGTCFMFEKVTIDDVIILGVQIESRKISKLNGLNTFAQTISSDLTSLVVNHFT